MYNFFSILVVILKIILLAYFRKTHPDMRVFDVHTYNKN